MSDCFCFDHFQGTDSKHIKFSDTEEDKSVPSEQVSLLSKLCNRGL